MSTRTAALAALYNRPLAWEQASLEATLQALDTVDTPQPPQAAARRTSSVTPNGAAGILPIMGPITYRPSFFSLFFGGTAIVELRSALKDLRDQRHVETIVLVVDSPGGEIQGLEEFAHELREARRAKPVIAVIDCLAASAAFWLACQADEIILTPSSVVGSVGVLLLHMDHSQMLEREGLRPTFIHAGRYKVEGNALEPLADEALKYLQASIDASHRTFIADIVKGRGRGLTADRVAKGFGEGRIVYAADALRRGMADRLFPTTDAAFTHAIGYGRAKAIRADLDKSDCFFIEHGTDSERRAASARLHARLDADVITTDDPQRQADDDYMRLGIRIAERL